jgi:hypothetical protein
MNFFVTFNLGFYRLVDKSGSTVDKFYETVDKLTIMVDKIWPFQLLALFNSNVLTKLYFFQNLTF